MTRAAFSDLSRWEGHRYRLSFTEAKALRPGDEVRNGIKARTCDLYSKIVRRLDGGAAYVVRNISAKAVPDEYTIASCLIDALFLELRSPSSDRFRAAVGLEDAAIASIRDIHEAWIAQGRPSDLASISVPPRLPYRPWRPHLVGDERIPF